MGKGYKNPHTSRHCKKKNRDCWKFEQVSLSLIRREKKKELYNKKKIHKLKILNRRLC